MCHLQAAAVAHCTTKVNVGLRLRDDRSVSEDMTTMHPSERETVRPPGPEVPSGWACPPHLRGRVVPMVVVEFADYGDAEGDVTIRPPRL